MAAASGRHTFQGPWGTGMCLQDRRLLRDLCAVTLELPGCCQRENRPLQVPSPAGLDGVEVTASWVGPTPIRPALLFITTSYHSSQAPLTLTRGSGSSRWGARQRTEGGGEAVCFSSEHDPSECLTSFSLNALNPASKTASEGKTR